MNTLSKSLKTVLALVALLAAAWFTIHFLALLGIFLAFGLPLLWFFAPRATLCFMCRVKKNGEFCSLCRQYVVKKSGLYPKTFPSVVLNSCILICLTLISLGLVFVENRLTNGTSTAAFVIPTQNQYQLGEIFSMKIEITGLTQPINAVQADIGFDPTQLEVVDFSTKESFATIFIQKEINNDAGYARITGGLPNPGFRNENGRGVFATVYLRGKRAGVAEVKYLPTSMILANNGKADNIVEGGRKVSYLITNEEVSGRKTEDQGMLVVGQDVLGESTANQLIFYDEDKTLGTRTDSTVGKAEKFDSVEWIYQTIVEFDRFVLSGWRRIFSLNL